ncbi:MAG: guanylate [Planctomycetota bacterium]|nr:MAG: guanylate [Planctomycetota bacterium]
MSPLSERRTVTVLFAGLQDFGPLSSGRSPEAVRDLLDRLFLRFRSAVESLGGTVDKFIDMTVMAVFGAPVAHEDDPVRAVRAAYALKRAAAEFGQEFGAVLEIRCGVNSGEVLWGELAGERATAMGDVVNVAQRLKVASAPGTVLVSDSVQRAASAHFRFLGLDPIHVKGRSEPVRAWLAGGESRTRTEFREVAGIATPHVGRERELEELLTGAQAPTGRFLVIEGDAGVGKSRLLAEVRRAFRVRSPDSFVALARPPEGGSAPLGPFAEWLRESAGGSGASGESTAGLRDYVRRVLEDAGHEPAEADLSARLILLSIGRDLPGAQLVDIEPGRRVSEIHASWERLLRARARGRCLLFCLEDLHDVDEATCALLAHLASVLGGGPACVLATSRPPAPVIPGFDVMHLRELSRADAQRLALGIFAQDLSADLATFLIEKSGGNPFYLEELSRFLREERLIGESPVRLLVPPERVPDGLQGLLVARLDALGGGDKEALKGASILGNAFWVRFLSRLLARDLGMSIQEAERRRIVEPGPVSSLPEDEEFVFRHALLRDAAYSLVTKKERARLHGLAADLLHERAASGGRRLRSMSAFHRWQAGHHDEALEEWRGIAEEAVAVGSLLEGLTWAREASSRGRSARISLVAARACAGLARYPEALAEAKAASEAGDASAETRDAADVETLRVLHMPWCFWTSGIFQPRCPPRRAPPPSCRRTHPSLRPACGPSRWK